MTIVRRGLVASLTASLMFSMALLAGCGEDGGGSIVEPVVDGKSDVARGVTQQGALDFNKARTSSFKADLEFHGYTFLADAGARVNVEITHSGSSASLDTTLFVYGPSTGSGSGPRLAQDDDSGWGPLSKLANLTLPKAGKYMVVVGTKDGLGRGTYRLSLTCASGVCGGEKLTLTHVTLPANLTKLADDATQNCNPCGISIDAYSYSYGGRAQLSQVAQSARALQDQPTQWTEKDGVSVATVSSKLKDFLLDGALTPIEAFVGATDLESALLDFEGNTTDGVELSAGVLVLHFPSKHMVITVYGGFTSG